MEDPTADVGGGAARGSSRGGTAAESSGQPGKPTLERAVHHLAARGTADARARLRQHLSIVQSPGYVAILQEMVHNVTVIPLDGRENLSGRIRQYGGDSRGRWEGDTLVVEVTNFNDKTDFRGSANIRSEELRVSERFTRIGRNTILYQFTVDDPRTWTQPWSAEFPLMPTEGPVFEYACHEGNYGLANILSGARAQEAAEAPERRAPSEHNRARTYNVSETTRELTTVPKPCGRLWPGRQ